MKNKILLPALCTLALAASATANAQNTYSGYFTEGYTYRYQMNPALTDSMNFVSIPAIGNINLGMQGNLHLTDVFYNVNGRTSLFTNPAVSASEVMKHIGDKNRIGFETRIGLLSGGFKAWGGYNTVSISARANVNASVPGSVFSLIKEGVTNKTYDITNLRLSGQAFAEIAFGHSRDLSQYVPGLRAGATLKVLIGAGNIDAYLHDANLALGENAWVGTTNADIYASVKNLTYKTKYDRHTGRDYVNGVDMDGFGMNGFGLGLDLGASYKLNEDWEFSAAILDFGFIAWGDTQYATTDGTQTVNTDAYIFNPDENADNSFSKEWKRLRNNFSDLYQLSDKGNIGTRTKMLAATLNFAGQYTFPLYRKLKFGLLNSTHINGAFTYTNFRLSANVAPVKAFSADANIAVGTFGCSFGWMLNVHPRGFNFFLGMDHTLGKLAKQGIPLSSNAQFNMGFNIPF